MTKQTAMVTIIIMRTHIGALFLLVVTLLGWQNPEFSRGVSEKANLSLAIFPILASLSSIPRRVQPALKNPVRELTCIAAATLPAAVLRAHRPGVMKPARVTAASLLAGVSKRAVGPVMAAAASAAANLELVHAEFVGGIRVSEVIRVVGVHVGEVFVEEGLVGKNVGGGGGSAAAEELPWGDVNVPEGFFEGEKLVRGLKLELVF